MPTRKKKVEENKEIAVSAQSLSSVNPEALLAQAIEKGVPVETMERLLAMRRELKAEWAKEQFDQAMASFQAEAPIIEKKTSAGGGSGFRYKYASLDHIVAQTKDIIAKNGLSYTFDSEKSDDSITTICRVRHVAGHEETSKFTIKVDRGAKMNDSQKDGSASTYGKRYAFCNAFGIMTGDEDTDANVETPDYPRPPKVSQKPSQDVTEADVVESIQTSTPFKSKREMSADDYIG